MFTLERYETIAEFRQETELQAVVEKLCALGYRALFRSAVAEIGNVIGVETSDLPAGELFGEPDARFYRSEGLAGEVFFTDRGIYLLQPHGARLLAWEVRPHSFPGQLNEFAKHVAQAAQDSLDGRRLRGMSFDWRPGELWSRSRVSPEDAAAKELKIHPATRIAEELEHAQVLIDPADRRLLLTLAKLGKTRSGDTTGGSEGGAVRLLDAGLVGREYLVTCRQDSHSICTLLSREELDAATGDTFRCPTCGRALREELVEEIYSPTDAGRAMLNGSHWMTVWVTDLLVEAGVPADAISWGAAAGEDEIDIVVETLGTRVFLELKDREFGLGDAYPFASRVDRYGGSFGVVISTESIGNEPRKYLRMNSAAPAYSRSKGRPTSPYASRLLSKRSLPMLPRSAFTTSPISPA